MIYSPVPVRMAGGGGFDVMNMKFTLVDGHLHATSGLADYTRPVATCLIRATTRRPRPKVARKRKVAFGCPVCVRSGEQLGQAVSVDDLDVYVMPGPYCVTKGVTFGDGNVLFAEHVDAIYRTTLNDGVDV